MGSGNPGKTTSAVKFYIFSLTFSSIIRNALWHKFSEIYASLLSLKRIKISMRRIHMLRLEIIRTQKTYWIKFAWLYWMKLSSKFT